MVLTEHALADRTPSPEYDLPARSTLVVDEAGTVSTPKLARLARLAAERQWRVILVGDPRQFRAVRRGGMFGHLVDTLGAVELDEVHRFTQEWEKRASLRLRAGASLRLRAGDPAALDAYQCKGPVHAGVTDEMEARVIEAWNEARDAGHTVALMANSNQTINRLNERCQQLLVDTGHLELAGPTLRTGDRVLYEGDEVVTDKTTGHLEPARG